MRPKERPESLTVSVERAAQLLGLGRSTLYAAIRRGEVPALRIGRRCVVRRGTLDRLLADGFEHTENGGAGTELDRMTIVHRVDRIEVARRGAALTRLQAVWQGWAGHLDTDEEVTILTHLDELVETWTPVGRA